MECPRCDGQGNIVHALIKANGAEIFICDECDAVWFTMSAIGIEPWVDYTTYMKSLGLDGTWKQLYIQD